MTDDRVTHLDKRMDRMFNSIEKLRELAEQNGQHIHDLVALLRGQGKEAGLIAQVAAQDVRMDDLEKINGSQDDMLSDHDKRLNRVESKTNIMLAVGIAVAVMLVIGIIIAGLIIAQGLP